MKALTLRSEGRYDDALAASEEALEALEFFGGGVSADAKIAIGDGLELRLPSAGSSMSRPCSGGST